MKRSWLLAILGCFTVAAGLDAQTNYVALGGTIMDPQHLAIPYASVTLTSVATAEERKVRANAHGGYEIGALLPGAYLLVAESKGFAVAQRSLQLEVGEQVTLDVTLKVGPNTETVTAITGTGQSGSAQPTWNTTAGGNTTDNGQVTWTNGGPSIVEAIDVGLLAEAGEGTGLDYSYVFPGSDITVAKD